MAGNEGHTAAAKFCVLWEHLTDLIGTSATATLVRRAAKYAESRTPSLARLVISKPAFDYEYVVPEHWNNNGTHELEALVVILQTLLVELTGTIVVQRLRAVPLLAPMFVEEES